MRVDRKRRRVGSVAIAIKASGAGAALLLVTLIGVSPNTHAADPHGRATIAGPVAARATCGREDHPETGVQGDAPLADRFANGIPRAFNCNLDLVGQAMGDGAAYGMAVTDRCLYYTQNVVLNRPVALAHPGTVVVDVVDPTRPKVVAYLDTPGAVDSDQSIAISLRRKLLITTSEFHEEKSGEMVVPGKAGEVIDIFDISNCTRPVLKFSGVIPRFEFHTGEFTADGDIFWAASGPYKTIGTVSALDVSDPSHPKVIAQWHPDDRIFNYLHGVSVSDDGKTAYVAGGNKGFDSKAHSWKGLKREPPHGVFVLDVSEVQSHAADPQIKEIGHLYWSDVTSPQFDHPMTVKGHKYLWFIDLMGALATFDVPEAGRSMGTGAMPLRAFANPNASSTVACKTYPGRPPYGYVSIVNVDHPERPVRVSGIRLAVDQPKYCPLAASEPRMRGYVPMYCNVDNYRDAQMMACGFGEAGVRVFDIRDVRHPKEIAYYKPPAAGTAVRKASDSPAYLDTSGTLQGSYHSADLTPAVYFANGDKQLWFISIDGGVQILDFSKELMQREQGLFSRDNSCNGRLRGEHGCG
jgi:LVIVD repeat